MARLLTLSIVVVLVCALAAQARAQFGPDWIMRQNQAIFNQAAAQQQAIFSMTNSAIARGLAAGNSGGSSISGVITSNDGTGSTVTYVGSNGKGVYRVSTFKK